MRPWFHSDSASRCWAELVRAGMESSARARMAAFASGKMASWISTRCDRLELSVRLADLGWTEFFATQLAPDEAGDLFRDRVGRVVEVQRARIVVRTQSRDLSIALGGSWFRRRAVDRPTTGDWVVLNAAGDRVSRVLQRKNVFRRQAAGPRQGVQLIAANVDTLFVVTSCNEDFNPSRLERYLALASDAGVDAVIVITKVDTICDGDSYTGRARLLSESVPVVGVDARERHSVEALMQWVSRGATIAFVGSSGVGKSTLVNTIAGETLTEIGSIREDDGKGRHTTSFRALYQIRGGGLLLDVPGMRELKLPESSCSGSGKFGSGQFGIEAFAEIEAIAAQCRFSDCAHATEPGCAVRKALDDGQLESRRVENYLKLLAEQTTPQGRKRS